MRPAGPAPGSAPAVHGSAAQEWATRRYAHLDNLKVILIAAIIVGHAFAGYSEALPTWDYADVNEVSLSGVTETVGLMLAGPFVLLLIPLLFLVAGLLTPPSLDRKGTAVFVRDRLVRLGVPFAAFVLLLWPLLLYTLFHPLGKAPGSYRAEFLRQGSVDTGVLWFVGVLLIFSLTYAGWVHTRRGHAVRAGRAEIHAGHLLLLAAGVSMATFLVRLEFPVNSEKYVDLNLFEWPSCMALFGLGIAGSRRGWLAGVPDRLRRRSRTATLTAVVALGAFMTSAAVLGVADEEMWGGWRWPAFGFAAIESTLAVFGPVWLLAEAQRHLERRLRWSGPAVSRSAYGAFMLQGLVLIGLAVALRPVPVPAELKALIVAGGGVAGSFALAWLLISRVPGVARIL